MAVVEPYPKVQNLARMDNLICDLHRDRPINQAGYNLGDTTQNWIFYSCNDR